MVPQTNSSILYEYESAFPGYDTKLYMCSLSWRYIWQLTVTHNVGLPKFTPKYEYLYHINLWLGLTVCFASEYEDVLLHACYLLLYSGSVNWWTGIVIRLYACNRLKGVFIINQYGRGRLCVCSSRKGLIFIK